MLIRFDPFRDLDRLSQGLWDTTAPARIPMDAVRHGDHVDMYFELPGVEADSIDVEVEKHALTVSAERTVDDEVKEGEEVLVRERRAGRFVRQVTLGDNLDPDKLTASYDGGVLTVEVPVAEQAKTRRVPVAAGPQGRPIEATASPRPSGPSTSPGSPAGASGSSEPSKD